MVRSIENLRKRKSTGRRRIASRSHRAYERNRYAVETVPGADQRAMRRVRASHLKVAIRTAEHANLLDPSTKKISKTKSLKTLKNGASRDYERRGVITKGAMIETEQGPARVTSRPGQDGVVNAVLAK
ncbi:MAG: 30S ribosomal protein S8e [Candidatus Geothermarchaeales archaeon]